MADEVERSGLGEARHAALGGYIGRHSGWETKLIMEAQLMIAVPAQAFSAGTSTFIE